ncbi:hypothetical protein TRIATDRAFT_302998 [Trichoderma atroviride IMI 206040]|uniref:Uncharacterized protein n=1 Tax=Hypocrea atroviridis (strain ATCC 20476 / IMI 206040) TaxID=452589 RepID=G9PBE2_HYPAI|nr:uncharacterized protein TRIATDRAFT_302998 [Trichoderma atroviride IMI 206040]EHK39689.1 hypothetical protein TRIATDRAFT_302998 [Trichoderma atroviride IMI 206040]
MSRRPDELASCGPSGSSFLSDINERPPRKDLAPEDASAKAGWMNMHVVTGFSPPACYVARLLMPRGRSHAARPRNLSAEQLRQLPEDGSLLDQISSSPMASIVDDLLGDMA